MKIPDRASLERRRPVIIADLLAKVEAEDWHGVADAAMDLREIDAALRMPIKVVSHLNEGTCAMCQRFAFVDWYVEWDRVFCSRACEDEYAQQRKEARTSFLTPQT